MMVLGNIACFLFTTLICSRLVLSVKDISTKNSPIVELPETDEDVGPKYVTSERIITRCRLRPVNYWNHTMGKPIRVVGELFDAAIGENTQHPYSNGPYLFSYVVRHPINHSFLNFVLSTLFGTSSNPTTTVNNSPKAASPSRRKITDSQCSLVFIYSQWCPYSMRAAPYINAIARAFPQIPVIAIESEEYLQYRWNLRVFYTPKIKIFIGGHIYREFNGTDSDLDELTDFIWKNIRQLPMTRPELRYKDFVGPVPTQLLRRVDGRLQAAWAVFLLCLAYLSACYVNYNRLCFYVVSATMLAFHQAQLHCSRRRRRTRSYHSGGCGRENGGGVASAVGCAEVALPSPPPMRSLETPPSSPHCQD